MPTAPATAPDLLAALRRRIADVVVEGAPTGGFGFGLGPLDAALRATGGVPRGRLTELLGTPGGGATTLVRRLVQATLATGAWVAVVDAGRTLAPADWAGLAGAPVALTGRPAGLWVVRPPDAGRGAWCADVLLRSGAFALVVLDGAPPLPRAVALRLLQLAGDADAALVVVQADGATRGSDLGGALRLRVRAADPGPSATRHPPPARGRRVGVGRAVGAPRPGDRRSERRGERRMVVTVEKGGLHRTLEVVCAIGVARRLCAHPEVPDRRPVAGARRGLPGPLVGDRPADSPAAADRRAHPGSHAPFHPLAHPRSVRRGRRCAEPALGRD